ncbi:SpoIIE family protein phosphatase [Streptomyces sp. BI20]|uniref:SpoIIE family protein phosphatase n=1 Tax=Streptomyces sp. BI20 TaxID=3403460 RepID=UPI003C7461B6
MAERDRESGTPAGAARGRALDEGALTAASDPGMERFARLTARLLRVPGALVALAAEDRWVLPGTLGPFASPADRRELPPAAPLARLLTPLGRSLDVSDVLTDARLPEGLGPALARVGVRACAVRPLTTEDGLALGALCALDRGPRRWEDSEREDLADLAAACSVELRLRILSGRRGSVNRVLETARAAADRDRGEAQRLEREAQTVLDHAELLLKAAEELAQSSGLEDVRRRLRDLLAGVGKPSYVALFVADRGVLHRTPDPDDATPAAREPLALPVDAAFPSARAAREGRTVFVPDRPALVAGFGPEAVALADRLGLTTLLSLPLWGSRTLLGVLAVGWAVRHEVGITERALLTAASGYVAQAVERARYLDERVSVARELQEAMLTDLPLANSVEISAFYQPAANDNMIGGDWYDAYHLPVTAPGAEPSLMITVGDITGHDVHAATVMGQVRSMLRQATLDHPPYSPATALTALNSACAVLPIEAGGTLVHARLDPAPPGAPWPLTWSNAGHPPPLLRTPDGRVARLTEHGVLLHPVLRHLPRTEHRRELPSGSTLLLYTDGLVERRGQDIDRAVDRLAGLLARYGDGPTHELCRRIGRRMAHPAPEDDVVMLALRVP